MKNFSKLPKLTKISLIINAIVLLIILVMSFRCFVDYKLLTKYQQPRYASLHYVSEEKERIDNGGRLLTPSKQRSYYYGFFYDIYLYTPTLVNEKDISLEGLDTAMEICAPGTKNCFDIEMKLFGKTIYEEHMVNPD